MRNILLGMATGDALGVPYEFIAKGEISLNPCTDMVGYGTHNQPIGTWSDDTSMALCIVDSLCNGLNYSDIADKFSKWFNGNLWTPRGFVFDFGSSTRLAINEWDKGETLAIECGGLTVTSNGNGSVMRTLALVPFVEEMDLDTRYTVISNISKITHGHWISQLSCFLVCEYAIALRHGFDKKNSLFIAIESLEEVRDIEISLDSFSIEEYDKVFGDILNKILDGEATDVDFKGTGYAKDTAVTSIWCLQTTNTFKEATLKAVNYGDDTDTTACVTGGLAGILYGFGGIPSEWLSNIVRKDDIIELVNKYESVYEPV